MRRRPRSWQLNSAINYLGQEHIAIQGLKDGTFLARYVLILFWRKHSTIICMIELNSLKRRFLIKAHVVIQLRETKSLINSSQARKTLWVKHYIRIRSIEGIVQTMCLQRRQLILVTLIVRKAFLQSLENRFNGHILLWKFNIGLCLVQSIPLSEMHKWSWRRKCQSQTTKTFSS